MEALVINCNCCSKYYVSDIVENFAFSFTDYEQQCEVFCSHLKVMHHFDKFHENKQQSGKKRGGINPANMFSHLYFMYKRFTLLVFTLLLAATKNFYTGVA